MFVGQHPEWITFTPDGKFLYVAAAGDNQVFVVDTARLTVSRPHPGRPGAEAQRDGAAGAQPLRPRRRRYG